MHIRFTTLMNIANWYGLVTTKNGSEDVKQFVPLAEICRMEPNGDYLLPVEGDRLILQTSAATFGTIYRLKLSTPERGLRMIENFDYPGLVNYGETNSIDISRVGEAPRPQEEICYSSNETTTPAAEPVEMIVVVRELDLFKSVEELLKLAGKPATKAS